MRYDIAVDGSFCAALGQTNAPQQNAPSGLIFGIAFGSCRCGSSVHLSEVSKRGWREGVGDKQPPQKSPNMDDWYQDEAWDSFPVNPTPTMTHAAHPVTTEVPPGYDGSTNWFKYADAVEEWCDLTKVEARRRGPAIAARLSGRAEIFKERLNRERLRDPETGVDYFLATLRPFFVKDLQSVFLDRFFQMLRCNRGHADHQRWTVKYEIARQKAVDAWLDATTPKPLEGEAAVVVQIGRLREAARDRQRQEVRRDWAGAPGDLAAAVNAVALPEATDAMREAAIEHVWRVQRRGRIDQFPISDNLSALMALVMADLSESQRETLMNLIYQRDIALTDLTLHQLRDFLITLFHAPNAADETLDLFIWFLLS